jgi:hypothetical protein
MIPMVRTAPEGDRQVDLPEQYCLHVGDQPVEQSTRWSDARSRQPHGVIGLGVEDV